MILMVPITFLAIIKKRKKSKIVDEEMKLAIYNREMNHLT